MKTVLALLLVILPLQGQEKTRSRHVTPILAAANGRYVFGQISEMRQDQILLDTQTGRMWRMVIVPTKGPDGQYTDVPALAPIEFLHSAPNALYQPE